MVRLGYDTLKACAVGVLNESMSFGDKQSMSNGDIDPVIPKSNTNWIQREDVRQSSEVVLDGIHMDELNCINHIGVVVILLKTCAMFGYINSICVVLQWLEHLSRRGLFILRLGLTQEIGNYAFRSGIHQKQIDNISI